MFVMGDGGVGRSVAYDTWVCARVRCLYENSLVWVTVYLVPFMCYPFVLWLQFEDICLRCVPQTSPQTSKKTMRQITNCYCINFIILKIAIRNFF